MSFEAWTLLGSAPAALAAVALLGYLVGRRSRVRDPVQRAAGRRDLRRARAIARELDAIGRQAAAALAEHRAGVARFRARLDRRRGEAERAAWRELCEEAERLIGPTQTLAARFAAAHDAVRRQTQELLAFSEVRTDPLTGLCNRRGLDEALAAQYRLLHRYGHGFSLILLDADHFKQVNDRGGHLEGDRVLVEIARLLEDAVRDTDLVCRFGGEEFVLLLPETTLAGAGELAERIRTAAEQKLPLTLSCGAAAAAKEDGPEALLSRADQALYAAKAAGRNRLALHDGQRAATLARPAAPAAASAVPANPPETARSGPAPPLVLPTPAGDPPLGVF